MVILKEVSMKKYFVTLFTVSVFMFGAVASYAGHEGPGRGRGPGGPFVGDIEKMKEQLGLSDAQVKQITEVNAKFKKQHEALRDKMKPKFKELKVMLASDTVDPVKVRALLTEMSPLHVEAQMIMIQHFMEIEKILTPDQRTKFKKEMKNRFKHGPPPPRGPMGMDDGGPDDGPQH